MADPKSVDWNALIQKLGPIAVQTLQILIAVWLQQPTPVQASSKAGCCDCGECLDCAIACQAHGLAMTVQAKQCLNPPAPSP